MPGGRDRMAFAWASVSSATACLLSRGTCLASRRALAGGPLGRRVLRGLDGLGADQDGADTIGPRRRLVAGKVTFLPGVPHPVCTRDAGQHADTGHGSVTQTLVQVADLTLRPGLGRLHGLVL